MNRLSKQKQYLLIVAVGIILWLEGKDMVIENLFIDIVSFFGTLPNFGIEIISSLVRFVITYLEILILFFILLQQYSKRNNKYTVFKKSFYIYIAIAIILEKILLFLCYNAFSIFFSSVLGTIIITVLVKIFLSFSVILILYKVSIEKKKYFLNVKQLYLLIL